MFNQWKKYKAELKKKNFLKYFLVDIVETVGVALILALILRQWVVQTSLVKSGSMIPTMMVQDRLFVNKMIYKFRAPKRGEIVLFKSPYDGKTEFVKRLVGLPGDKIEIKRGIVYINDKQLVFPGVNIQRDYSYFGPITVPPNSYFMMGDNRAESADSRIWGFVKRKDLVGKAIFNYWPINRIKMLH